MPPINTRCLALYVILLFYACSRGGPGSIVNGKVSVTVNKATVEEKKPLLSLAATLTPTAKAVFKFPIDIKIDKVNVRLGEGVSQGDILFTLNEMALSLKVGGLKAKRQEKKALFDKNSYFLENRERLLEEGKIDRAQYDTLESEVSQAKAEVDKLDTDIQSIENQIASSSINAPFDGVVSQLNLASGATIPLGEALLTLVQIDPIYVSFSLPATDAGSVALGMNVDCKIEGSDDKPLQASITFISPELDPATHTFEIKASLPNKGYIFKGGSPAQVSFLSQRTVRVLKIPASAISKEGDKEFVYIIREGKAWPVSVATRRGVNDPNFVEIEGGLKEEDLVVTEGEEKLKAGAEVNLWR